MRVAVGLQVAPVNTRLAALATVVLLTGCPTPTPTTDGGATVTPVLTSISPTRGAVAGGTTVTLNGTNFVSGATVAFGGVMAAVTFESDRKVTAVTPPGAAGVVAVTLTNPNARATTLNAAFTYDAAITAKSVSEAVLQNPADATDTSGAATVTVVVGAHVEVPTVTAGAGQGAGVRAQVGFSTTVGATPLSADFTWTDSMYVGDVDGAGSGDKARDSYAGTVSLPAPTTGAQVVYFVAARFSVDDGQSWTIADRDGAANGSTTTQLSKVTVMSASVEWCKLGGEIVTAAPTVSLRGNTAGPVVYGQVFKAAVTTTTGAGTGIKGALGYGPAGSDPSTWTWVDATFNTDTGGGANDEFQAMLPNPGVGTYKFAFRFSHANGPWSYCDADGLASNGYTEDQAGTLTVQGIGVDSCNLQFPTVLSTWEGRPSSLVYGRVFVQGLTEAVGAGAGIEGAVGYGAPATAPGDPSWTWSAPATFNVDDMGGGDEYQAAINGPVAGTYAYAYRFRVAGGAWTYCDKNGSADGVQQAELGALTAAPFDVTNCYLESANSAQSVLPNSSTAAYGMGVTVPTLTDAVGQGVPLAVSLGYGAVGTAPSTWTTWAAATYATDLGMTSDRYTATLTSPATPSAYAVAFKVQVGTKPAVYCDLDGSQNGYLPAQSGRMTVATALITACKLNTVSMPVPGTLQSGTGMVVTARATIPGANGTSAAGAAPNLRVEIGTGPQGSNASTSTLWGWQSATYAAEASGADEFSLKAFPAYTGTRAVAARASLDGVSWTYCDLNGSDVGGYEVAQQYDVAVTNHTDIGYCNTQFPAAADGGSTIYGQVYSAGLTPNAATPFIAQLGFGPEEQDPGLAWTWIPATFFVIPTAGGETNNNEYRATLPTTVDAGLHYAYRFSLDGGSWCFGDLRTSGGSSDGFSGGSSIGLVTTP